MPKSTGKTPGKTRKQMSKQMSGGRKQMSGPIATLANRLSRNDGDIRALELTIEKTRASTMPPEEKRRAIARLRAAVQEQQRESAKIRAEIARGHKRLDDASY